MTASAAIERPLWGRFVLRDRHAAAILLVVLATCLWRPLFLGEVVFPHPNDLELGLSGAGESERPSNRRFSDQSSQYVPELHHQLNGHASGWISTWNPHVELGRPTSHVAAISKAFWLTRGLSWFSSDAFRVYTALSLLAIAASAFFALGFLRAEGLSPTAALAGALGVGLGVFSTFWATYALFGFGLAWTFAWLWSIRRLLDGWSPLWCLAVVVSVQALLLTAYPQQIVWHVWFAAIYTLHAASRGEGGIRARVVALAAIAAASLLGVLASLPVYLDLAIDAARSVRLDTPMAFFQSVLPDVRSVGEALAYGLQIFDASLFGNPIEPGRPISFEGVSLTPLYAFGVFASFLDGGLRRLWPFHLFVAFALLATFSPTIYGFGVEYLGLSLSRFVPLAGALVPIALLAASGFDAVLRRPERALWPTVGFVVGCAGWTVAAYGFSPVPLVGGRVVLTGAVSLLIVALAWSRRPAILLAIAIASVFVYAQPLLLVRPKSEIHTDSPLVEALRSLTMDGSRFAWVGWNVIPSNQESLLGLRSIHAYDSLSSKAYQRWTEGISDRGASTQGRYFQAIRGRSALSEHGLRQAGVGVLAAPVRLDPGIARPMTRSGRFWLHRMRRDPIVAGQVTRWSDREEGGVRLEDGAIDSSLPIELEASADDRATLELTPLEGPSLVWLSRQYHPRWTARANGERLETVIVDGLYQGVFVPRGVSRLELRFEPAVRYAWIPQACLLVALPVCALATRRGRRGRTS